MSSYFTLPSFARAKKNKETLQKTNPQTPVLKDDDEQYLQKHLSNAEEPKDVPPITIADDGKAQEATTEQQEEAGVTAGHDILPETQPETSDGAQESKDEKEEEPDTTDAPTAAPEATESEHATDAEAAVEEVKETPAEAANETGDVAVESEEKPAKETDEPDKMAVDDAAKPEEATRSIDEPEPPNAESTEEAQDAPTETADKTDDTTDDPPEQAPDESHEKANEAAAKQKKSKKKSSFDLPSQEEAEAATKGFGIDAAQPGDRTQSSEKTAAEKRTWASYLPTVGSKKDQPKAAGGENEKVDSQTDTTSESKSAPAEGEQRTWTQLASSYVPSIPAGYVPSISSIPSWRSNPKDKDSNVEPVLNEDGSINEAATKEKQEKEVSVLLDNLDLSSINNRVFAFSSETQHIYSRFAQVLRDTMDGGPTAYEDMEKLMRDAGPQLEKQFDSMPPFVQTLVKSLPARLGSTLGPELLAAATEKPGDDMRARMTAASKSGSGGGGVSVQQASTTGEEPAEDDAKDGQQKKKRRIPGLKGLVSQQGAVASMLRSTVNFLTVRFPFLASTTNVVMSLAVFILLFVFWYSHKRGKETRLAREQHAGASGDGAGDAGGDTEVEVTDDEEEGEGEDGKIRMTAAVAGADEAEDNAKAEAMDQAEPTEVPLKKEDEEKVLTATTDSAPADGKVDVEKTEEILNTIAAEGNAGDEVEGHAQAEALAGDEPAEVPMTKEQEKTVLTATT